MEEKEEKLSEIKLAIDQLLNIDSKINRRKKSEADKKKELFIGIINSIEQVINRQSILYSDFKLDMGDYDENFLEIIDALLVFSFGKDQTELIQYFLWERLAPDGDGAYVEDANGNEVEITDASMLWDILTSMTIKNGKKK
jgi:hypothetical protein